MDGPAHYKEGEKAFLKAKNAAASSDGASAVLYMQAATFHAIMALVAACAGRSEDWESVYYRDQTGEEL